MVWHSRPRLWLIVAKPSSGVGLHPHQTSVDLAP